MSLNAYKMQLDSLKACLQTHEVCPEQMLACVVGAQTVGLNPAQILTWVVKYGQTAIDAVNALVSAYHQGTLATTAFTLIRNGAVIDMIESIVFAVESLFGVAEETQPAVG